MVLTGKIMKIALLECSATPAGQSSESGLRLQSFRTEDGLKSGITFPKKFQAFPGIVNGGLVSTVFDCQGNWTSAIALMDASQLPKPPFTLSSTIQVDSCCVRRFKWDAVSSKLWIYHGLGMLQAQGIERGRSCHVSASLLGLDGNIISTEWH